MKIPRLELFVSRFLPVTAAMPQTNMTVKYLSQLVFLICLYRCSVNSIDQKNRTGQTEFGLSIINGQRQGFQHFDSTGTEFNYRYNTITITNDTLIPIRIEIGFQATDKNLSNSSKSKYFLLPRRLTPAYQHMDTSLSQELKQFLDFEINTTEHLNKTINPKEKCVLTFGVLTDANYPDPTTPYQTKLLTEKNSSSKITLKLKINDTLTIPCGHVTYIQK